MQGLIDIGDIPAFREVKRVNLADVTEALRKTVRELHEADEIEEYLRSILSDRASTPHGPAEIVDILTHRIRLGHNDGLAAFLLKGRSFPTVRPKDISHQIYRLEKISDLKLAVLGATGVILDAAKEQFVSTCKRLGIRYSIFDADNFGRLFWAYGFLCPRDGMRIRGGRCHCGYAPKYAALNILQEEALAELKIARTLAQSKALVVLPPGCGKTRIAALDANASGARNVLYVAHTNEILDVAVAEFGAVFGANNTVVWRRGPYPSNHRVVLSTVQYLSRNLTRIPATEIKYLVVDEFHHAAARTYRQIVDRLDSGFLLGLTATPFRADKQDIATLCDQNIVVNYEIRSGIDTGILTPYHYFGCFDNTDYTDLVLRAGGYTIRDLERKLIIPERHQAVIEKWNERAADLPTLAFCCSHQHARKVAAAFRQASIAAEPYLSSTSQSQRQALIERLRVGKLKILCVVDIMNEGADVPFAECLLFLRPTESKRIFLQQLGRGLRKYVGKSHCVVIDLIGNFKNAYKVVEYHGLRTDVLDQPRTTLERARNTRELLDLPVGCKVDFEDKVLDIFAKQSMDPKSITRENIGRILIHRYWRLCKKLGRPATSKDVDLRELLDSSFYRRIFGSWEKFIQIVADRK